MKRLNNLDYLRGVAALGIMIYHYLSWSNGPFGAETFLGRVGLYGVSMFYVLSGLTLFYVYEEKLQITFRGVAMFFSRRILRIYPLLWMSTVASIIISFEVPNVKKLLLNLSGLFGFVSWDEYYATGAWSIGNELVFYSLFPILLFVMRESRGGLLLMNIFVFCFFLYLSFFVLQPSVPLDRQWYVYVSPINHLMFFLAGMMIGLLFKGKQIHSAVTGIIGLVGLSLFLFYPVTGDPILLVTGVNRIVLSFSCFLICFFFYKQKFPIPKFLDVTFATLGEISYSVYLLHAIIYFIVRFLILSLEEYFVVFSHEFVIVLSICATLVVSYFTYNYFEKYFLRLGKVKIESMISMK